MNPCLIEPDQRDLVEAALAGDPQARQEWARRKFGTGSAEVKDLHSGRGASSMQHSVGTVRQNESTTERAIRLMRRRKTRRRK